MNIFDLFWKSYKENRNRLEIDTKVDIIKGVATSGSNTTIADTTKNFTVNALANMTANVTIGGVEYIRKITSNTADTITIPTLGADVKASAVVYPDADNEITVVCVTATGVNGNAYNVEVVYGEGNSQPLAAAFTSPTITVTLATDGNGDPDDADNTGTLVAAAIDTLAGFSATVTGTDGSLACTDLTDVDFSGGVDAPVVAAGCYYGIILTDVVTATLNAETTKIIGTVNSKVADGQDVTLGAKADAAATAGDATPFSVVALLKGIFAKLLGTLDVQLSGSILEEQLIETDAVEGVITFTNNISIIEIFNTDSENAGVFTVNGIALHVPSSQVYKAKIGGVAGKTVTVTGATTYIVSTYV